MEFENMFQSLAFLVLGSIVTSLVIYFWSNQRKYAFLKRYFLQTEANSIFQRVTDLVPTGLMAIDDKYRILMANPAAEQIFSYERGEMVGLTIDKLVGSAIENHDALMASFFKAPSQKAVAMAGGRVVQGKTKNGSLVDIEIGLNVNSIRNKRFAYIHVTAVETKQKLSEENQKLLNISKRSIEAVQDGVWEWQISSNTGWWNYRLSSMIGLPPGTPYNYELWFEHIHNDDKERVNAAVNNALSGQSNYQVEYRGKAVDGEYRWFRARGSVSFVNKKPKLMVGTLSDINDEIKTKQELQEKSKFLNSIISRSVSGIYTFDLLQKKNTYVNPVYTQITGYTLSDLHAQTNFMAFFHPDDISEVEQHINKVLSSSCVDTTQLHTIDYRFKHKKGHWVWLRSVDSIFKFNEKNEAVLMLGTFIDISIQKENEQELSELASSFSSIFEQAAVGICRVELKGNFSIVNQKLCDILGYTRQEFLILDFQQITHPQDLDGDLQRVNELLCGDKETYVMEKRYRHKSGYYLWALLTVSLVRNSQGEPLHFISIIEDITERKNIEYKLSQSNKALEYFAYTASHDLQEPLRKISAFTDVLKSSLSELDKPPNVEFELNRICAAANRMSKMIKSLLELSKYYNEPLNIQPLDFSRLLTQFEADYCDIVKENQTEIICTNNFTVHADEVLFQIVVNNILHNAIKYKSLNKAPKVTIWQEEINGVQRLYFSDNGIGIQENDRNDIFLPFKRLVGKEYEGVGMGLASCLRIIDKHQGNIDVYPNEGEGSTFIVDLPLGDANA